MNTQALRVGLYPGTFDPMTNGHMDIIERALKLVDTLVIGVAINEGKSPLFNLDERVEMVEKAGNDLTEGTDGRIIVEPFNNLLVQFADKVGAGVIIRGLRAVSDFEYEFQMVGMNRVLNDNIETVFLMAEPVHQAISSSLVKEIAKLGGDTTRFVPPYIQERILNKLGRG